MVLKKIYSNADKITVQAYGRNFMTFNKEDFGNDWQNLIDKGEIFDIGPLDVADLDKVTCTGTEIKKPEYDTETRNKWFNYAHQFLDITDADNEEKLSDIDFDKPIILCNKTASNNLNLFSNFISKYRDSNVESEKEKYNKLLFDLSHFTFPSGDFVYKEAGNYKSNFVRRLGNVTVFSTADKTFGSILGADKIVKVPADYIDSLKGNLYGAFSNCSSLDIDCKSLTDIKLTCLNYAFYKCKSVKNINYIDLSNITSYSYLDNAFTETELEEIPENFLSKMAELTQAKPFKYCKIGYIDEAKNGNFLVDAGNTISKINKLNINGNFRYGGIIGSINYIQNNSTGNYISASSTIISKIGIINSPNYSGFAFNSSQFPESVVAFPYYNFTSTFSIPNSTGYEYWADYIKEDTIACKNITERSLVISDHIDTLDSTLKNFKVKIPYNELLKAVANYNHTFEIIELKSIFTNTDRTVTNAVYNSASFDNNTKDVIIDVDFTNIKDDSISTIQCSKLGLYYVAKIDNYDFTGKTLVDLTIRYDFTINENVDMSLSLVDDDTEEAESNTIVTE